MDQKTKELIDKEIKLISSNQDISGKTSLKSLNEAIEFDNVSFSYGEQPTLRDITLHARPGETIALVGPTGAGKSTIVNLLCRFYEYDSGSITIDGQELNQTSKSSLRSALGYVTQEAFLFNGSVRENLLLAKPEADETELWKALESALSLIHI